MQTLETKRIAKAVCKKIQPLLAVTLGNRPRADTGYTMLQGYRSAMTLSVGACRRFGMSEDEVRAAMESTLAGFREEVEMPEEPREPGDPFADVKSVEFTPPPGWSRGPNMGDLAAMYQKKKLRLVVSEVLGVMMVSISKARQGRPGHPTDAQCEEVLVAFGLTGLEEVPMTTSARYFKAIKDGAS